MARMNAFLSAGNDYRQTSIGGRGRSDSCWARLNTDNAGHTNCCLAARVDVTGEKHTGGKLRKLCDCGYRWQDGLDQDHETQRWIPQKDYDATHCPECGAMRQGIDTRRSEFVVTLPDAQDSRYCTVLIQEHGADMKALARLGGMLACIKSVDDITSDDPDRQESGKKGLEAIKDIMSTIDNDDGDYANVTLPTGVSLKKALACVEIVENLIDGKGQDN